MRKEEENGMWKENYLRTMPLVKIVFNPLRFISGLLIGLFIIGCPGLAQANGGTTVLVEKLGAYELTITASPYPLQVGENDVNALVGRLADQQLVLDAQVTMTAEPLDRPGESQAFMATHDTATNKLYYHANMVFPTPGRWKLTVTVEGPEDSVSTVFETQVAEKSSLHFLRNISLVGLPLIIIAILFFVMSRRAEKAFEDTLEGEA
jgi:hypothetical protein